MDKKARENKKTAQQQKLQASKTRTIGVKSRIKGVPPKKQKNPKDGKTKIKPAPFAEAGFSMYSTDSEDVGSVLRERNTCQQVLNMLQHKRREKGPPDMKCVVEETRSTVKEVNATAPSSERSAPTNRPTIVIPSATIFSDTGHVGPQFSHTGVRTPFNARLSSSTPDPDRPQVIPERDTNSHKGIQQPPNLTNTVTVVPASYQSINPSEGAKSAAPYEVAPSGSDGFVPASDVEVWHRRDSDIRTFQAYIPRESTGFVPINGGQLVTNTPGSQGNNQSSGSSGEKNATKASQSTGNSSGTEYIYFPRPVVEVGNNSNIANPVQVQNGLYQIRPLNPSSTANAASQLFGAELVRIATPTASIASRPNTHNATGQQNTESHRGQIWEAPERDTNDKVVTKVANLNISPDSISTITATEIATPRSVLTSSSGVTPRSIQTTSMVSDIGTNQERQQASDHESSGVKTYRTQSSHFSEITPASDWSGGQSDTLYQMVETQAGRQLIPITIVRQQTAGLLPNDRAPDTSKGSTSDKDTVSSTQNSKSLPETGHQPMTLRNNELPLATSDQPIKDKKATETSVEPNPWSRVRLDTGLKRLRYIISEIKECSKITKDVEVGRLAKELEKSLEQVPQLSSTFSLQAEVDLALQPLRSENAQLRRKLRLANQNLKDQVKDKDNTPPQLDLSAVQLQASNTALQSQLKEEKELKVRLAAEVTSLHGQIQRMQIDRNKLLTTLSEKETESIKIKQECLSDAQKFRHQMESLGREAEAIRLQNQASDQENHILQISLQQRDAEINRLQNMVQVIKESVNDLVQELENTGDKSFTSNNSFHRLIRILGNNDKPVPSPGKSILSEPRHLKHHDNTVVKTLRFDHPPPSPQLTRANLASHNQLQKAGTNTVFRESNSDSEVELTIEEYRKSDHPRVPRQRRRSSSPTAFRMSSEGVHKRSLSSSPRHVEKLSHLGNHNQRDGSFMKLFNKVFKDEVSDHYVSKGVDSHHTNEINDRLHFGSSNPGFYGKSTLSGPNGHSRPNSNMDPNRSEASMSRYSVTDYFSKYPIGFQQNDSTVSSRNHHRAYSQPVRLPSTSQPLPDQPNWKSNIYHPMNEQRTSNVQSGLQRFQAPVSEPSASRVSHDIPGLHDNSYKQMNSINSFQRPTPIISWNSHERVADKRFADPRSRLNNTTTGLPQPKFRLGVSPQDNLFHGTVLDNSISAIDDDNISSVSGSGRTLSSDSTVNESKFRQGIATLDANILKLQLDLQKTKNMLH